MGGFPHCDIFQAHLVHYYYISKLMNDVRQLGPN